MKKSFPVKYTSKNYDQIKEDLVEYTKRYYSENFKDFSDANFASLMLDSVAYVGDILSFYIDYQTNETFLNTALEQRNVFKIAKQLGYKNNLNATSYGNIAIYLLLPSNQTGLAPDYSYAPIIKKGSTFSDASGNVQFILNEDVNVSQTNTIAVPAKVDTITGNPTFWAVKVYGRVISGVFASSTIEVGNFVKNASFTINDSNVSEIISVKDSEGNEYYEVDYLTQNIVYKSILNKNSDSVETPNILIPYNAARRFTVEYFQNSFSLSFGGGRYLADQELRNDLVAEPSKTIIDLYGNQITSDTYLDPNLLVNGDTTGIAPENTTLTVEYRKNSSTTLSVSANSLTNILTVEFEYKNRETLSETIIQLVNNSLQVINEEPINSNATSITLPELKEKILNNFSAQGRAVTMQDYESACYNMPSKFGTVKRARAYKNLDSLKNSINLYVISQDNISSLSAMNSTAKENLKTWLNKNKVMTDTIEIYDAKIINLGINFKIFIDSNYNGINVLQECKAILSDFYSMKAHIGQPFYITDVYRELRKVTGVLDVKNVEIINKVGSNYRGVSFDVDANTSTDGRYINIPMNAVYEIKFLNSDIIGNVV